MIEQIVSFETAKLANEKGFEGIISTIRGYHYYNKNGILDGSCEESIREYMTLRESGLSYSEANEANKHKNISAPSQSVLQKWLRETYNMFVVVTPEFYLDGINHNVQVLTYNNTDHDGEYFSSTKCTGMFGDNGEFKTYEEALEFGLIKALNLI